jgi:hypothetical protein
MLQTLTQFISKKSTIEVANANYLEKLYSTVLLAKFINNWNHLSATITPSCVE